jgi:hypothetical protein
VIISSIATAVLIIIPYYLAIGHMGMRESPLAKCSHQQHRGLAIGYAGLGTIFAVFPFTRQNCLGIGLLAAYELWRWWNSDDGRRWRKKARRIAERVKEAVGRLVVVPAPETAG